MNPNKPPRINKFKRRASVILTNKHYKNVLDEMETTVNDDFISKTKLKPNSFKEEARRNFFKSKKKKKPKITYHKEH